MQKQKTKSVGETPAQALKFKGIEIPELKTELTEDQGYVVTWLALVGATAMVTKWMVP